MCKHKLAVAISPYIRAIHIHLMSIRARKWRIPGRRIVAWRSRNGTLGRPRGVASWRWRRGGGTGPGHAGFARRGKAPLRLGLSRRDGGGSGLSGRLSKDRTKGTVCTWPCNIYVSSYVTHVPALGSECVSQDCASGRSGQSLDGSRAEHLSIPIPENAEHCPCQRFVAGNEQ
jgi:hypothetical protein